MTVEEEGWQPFEEWLNQQADEDHDE